MNKYLNIQQIQNEEKKLLKILIDYLDNNNITYSVGYGTLLGTIRHKGFIPWDDDIDIIIKRDDYNKLIEIIKKNNCKIDDNIEMIGSELKNSDWTYLKLINKNFIVDEKENCDKFLWIDIFPMDFYPDNYKIYSKNIKFFRKILYLKREDVRNINIIRKNKIKNLLMEILKRMLRVFKYEKMLSKYLELCSKYNNDQNSKYIGNIVFEGGSQRIFNKQIFDKIIKLKFEDIQVNVISDFDYVLKNLYGNYMEIPPESHRISHQIKVRKKEK